MRRQTGAIQLVVGQARMNEPYLVPNTLLMTGDISLCVMNDSDSHVKRKDGMAVVMGPDAIHI